MVQLSHHRASGQNSHPAEDALPTAAGHGSDVEVIADDNTAGILWCPPVYGIYDDRLWMVHKRETSADHIHALDPL